MPTIKTKSIDDILKSLKGQAMKELKEEFSDLLKTSRKDSKSFIKESANNAARWLMMLGNKQLTRDEVNYLLKQQKKHAQIFANTQTIAVKARVQKLIYRLLDISIDVLTGAIAVV